MPSWILPLKTEVDRDRRPGRFVLTGSANLLRIPRAEDSLARRAMTVRLYPVTQGELQGMPDDWATGVLVGACGCLGPVARQDVIEGVVRDGYPPVQGMTSTRASRMATTAPRPPVAWDDPTRASRMATGLRQPADRAGLDGVGRAQRPVLRRLWSILATAVGDEVVLERLADELGVNRDPAGRYLDLLEGLFPAARLPSWSRNLTSRQNRGPKAYLADTGLVAVRTGPDAAHLASPQGADHLGPLTENYVVGELLRQQRWSASRFELAHHRDRNGTELDVIVETPQGIIAVAVTSTTAARPAHFKHLMALRDRQGTELLAGIFLNCGGAQRSGDRLLAWPLSSLRAEPSLRPPTLNVPLGPPAMPQRRGSVT